jgi:hypothetical protein
MRRLDAATICLLIVLILLVCLDAAILHSNLTAFHGFLLIWLAGLITFKWFVIVFTKDCHGRTRRYTQDDLDLLGEVQSVDTSDRPAEWRCAICLCNSVGNHEKLRELNICKHVFHHACIDGWLLARLSECRLKEPSRLPTGSTEHISQLTCPLCRTAVFG